MNLFIRIAFCLLSLLIVIFFSPFVKFVTAAAPTMTSYPSETLNLDTSFIVIATMSGLSKSATYRLRVAIAQSGTSNYFGSTYDGASWHMGSITDGNFISITTDGNGAWGGNIQGKIDSDDPNFTTGSGVYDLKIGRYTQTGNTATWSDPASITISVPPTPTPTNTPMPVSNTPTSTDKPTPTIKNSSTPTNKPTISSTNTPTLSIGSNSAKQQNVLGETSQDQSSEASDILIISPSITPIVKTLSTTSNNLSKVMIAIGIIFLAICGILSFKTYRKRKSEIKEI